MSVSIELKEKNTSKRNRRARSRMLFYSLVVVLPLLQFCVFYICVNFNSFVLSFQQTNPITYQPFGVGFKNFKTAFNLLGDNFYMINNSLILFLSVTGVGLTLAIIFSFYIYKKKAGSGLFKVILFIPKVIPSVVFTIIFKYMTTDAYINIVEDLTGKAVQGLLDASKSSAFWTVLIYNVWLSFGVNVILFIGAMSGINEAVVESAQIDGVTLVQEFWHITVPMIFPTLVTFIVVGIAGVFGNQMHLFTIFSKEKGLPIATIGYYIYLSANLSDVVQNSSKMLTYHELSAMGLILTMIVFPVTLIVKKLLNTFGPRVD